jgi:5-oxopent-3-ene-1,2,5-tricarboxylate decarboxylase/2-hydroxyhepta-2,4-diene-1,7-dioate isomerase
MTSTLTNHSLVCVALNDREHLQALEPQLHEAPYKQPPTQPVLYFKPRNTFSDHKATVTWPQDASALVVGASLVLVIGRETCRIKPEQALDHLQGFTLMHDFSLPEKSYYRPDIKGKCLDGSAPIGARVIDKGEVSDWNQLEVTTAINGEEVRRLGVADLHRSPAELLSAISTIMTLQPGDMIAIGFPAQRAPLQIGDRVISGLQVRGDDAGMTLCELANQVGE